MQQSPVLIVDGLAAGYPGEGYVLKDATFTVMPGERIALIGPNGAGKSTLLKTIAGLIPHSEGNISIRGESCEDSHSMVGYVPQQDDIDWTFPVNVWDVVMMGRTRKIGWLRRPRQQDRKIVSHALQQVGMWDFAQRQIGQLSGGQKRRVFIARALAQETDVLLMDEPFNGVDVSAEQEIMQVLDQLTADGVTILLATHNLSMAAQHFDKLLLVKQKMLAFGTSDEVLRPDLLEIAYGSAMHILRSENAAPVLLLEN
ncbi:MAG: metal ABC transporter ATP-binding protein [Aggregatilineales bacterium]